MQPRPVKLFKNLCNAQVTQKNKNNNNNNNKKTIEPKSLQERHHGNKLSRLRIIQQQFYVCQHNQRLCVLPFGVTFLFSFDFFVFFVHAEWNCIAIFKWYFTIMTTSTKATTAIATATATVSVTMTKTNANMQSGKKKKIIIQNSISTHKCALFHA